MFFFVFQKSNKESFAPGGGIDGSGEGISKPSKAAAVKPNGSGPDDKGVAATTTLPAFVFVALGRGADKKESKSNVVEGGKTPAGVSP